MATDQTASEQAEELAQAWATLCRTVRLELLSVLVAIILRFS